MTPFGSNNNLYTSNMTSPVRENILIDNEQCTENECNQFCCPMSNDANGTNNELYGKLVYYRYELEADP